MDKDNIRPDGRKKQMHLKTFFFLGRPMHVLHPFADSEWNQLEIKKIIYTYEDLFIVDVFKCHGHLWGGGG